MKDRGILYHLSDQLSEKSTYYRKVNNMHEKMSPWVKAVHGFAVISLAVSGACQRMGLTPVPTESYPKPNTSETLQPTEIPSTPEVTPGIGEVQFLNQDEVLAISVARKTDGTLVPLSEFYENSFRNNQEIKDLFEDPNSISYSAMGIRVFDSNEGRTIVYPFLSAVSEAEGIGFTGMVLVPEPGRVVAPILNKIVTPDGKVGLGITQDIYTGEDLDEPILIFETGLTEAQIAAMTPEELAKINILFIPAGVNIPYENVGAGKVNAIVARREAAQTINEIDLRPAYTQDTEYKYMGVDIHAQLITDESLDPSITKVTVPDSTYAEFIARSIFKVWWKKGVEPHTGVATEADFQNFMALWAKAQTSGLAEDWQKVQINNIWANDLNDGNGYVQKPYSLWPMYEGNNAPEGVRAIETFSIALVNGKKVENITLFDNNAYGFGEGINLSRNTLYLYDGFVSSNSGTEGLASGIATAPWWMIVNHGSSYSGYGSVVQDLTKLLMNGGLQRYP